MKKHKYLIYATLLDGFQSYLSSSEIYQEYWGFSEDPAKSEEEFEKEQFQSLIDRINRVPFDSEAADQGTAFNEVIDCLVENRPSLKMTLKSIPENDTVFVEYNKRAFTFPLAVCREFGVYFKGAVTQFYVEATLPTKYGDVLLYGFIDELLPQSAHDIKTTSKYKAGKFRNHWQHIVYPYCLNANGNSVMDFEYNVAVLNGLNFITFTEYYAYKAERDVQKLTGIVEDFIEFLNTNRNIITDKKIFNLK